ncbi:prolyl oligopeptidase family serine peptidase [Oxalobacteraceae bacterium]|nr:prolyl oligopeptidase family serine peptidase [Oxalobacteraceae bacterium]
MRQPPCFLQRAGLPALVACATLYLSACGGGNAGSNPGNVQVPETPTPPVTLRGTLIGSASVVPVQVNGTAVNTLTPAAMTQLLDNAQAGSSSMTGAPVCSITTYTVKYHTVGGAGEATDASTAIMVPSGSAPECNGNRPVLLYAHGTSVQKSTDMANLAATEPRLIAAMFAGQGYIVVAPNYAGYAGSSLGYHAYLDATQQSNDMVDALKAARLSYSRIGALASSDLFVTGYSQGGHVALATQRAMQTTYASEFTVTAAAGLSGPYALARFGDTIFGGSPSTGSAAFLPLLINAGQRANAAIYTSTGDIYESKYASGIDLLFPGASSIGDLVAAGKLPNDVLFAADSLPQAAGASAFFGAGNLIKGSYRNGYLADKQANACDNSIANPLSCAPAQNLRKWLVKNDLRNYLPSVPLLLCGGDEDPIVPFFNTEATSDYFKALGMTANRLTTLNIDGGVAFGPFSNELLAFQTAKGAVRAAAFVAGGNAAAADKAVRDSYHAGLVAPFCLRSAREFFKGR